MIRRPVLRRLAVLLVLAGACVAPARAVELGTEGQVFEILEEDFRMALMRMIARHDWTPDLEDLKDSAENYTKELPSYMLPRAEKTATRWKDVGIVVSEDIYLPWVEWETGSVFEPEKVLAAQAGSYFNLLAEIPAAAIERLFVFDATDAEQLETAKALMRLNVPQLSFMLIAGDLGPLAKEMQRPIYHPPPTMLQKFHVRALPTLIGFGRGRHQGHMAITEFTLPVSAADVQSAWFGLGDDGIDTLAEQKKVSDNPRGSFEQLPVERTQP